MDIATKLRSIPSSTWLKFILWLGLLGVFTSAEFGGVFLVISALYLMWSSLSNEKKDGDISAYSVFNKDGYAMPGSVDAQQFEREIRHEDGPVKPQEYRANEGTQSFKEHYKRKSKAANQPCVCGSGKKYKKCCFILKADSNSIDQEYEQWKEEWG